MFIESVEYVALLLLLELFHHTTYRLDILLLESIPMPLWLSTVANLVLYDKFDDFRSQHQKWKWQKYEEDLKYKDNPKKEDNLKNEDSLKN